MSGLSDLFPQPEVKNPGSTPHQSLFGDTPKPTPTPSPSTTPIEPANVSPDEGLSALFPKTTQPSPKEASRFPNATSEEQYPMGIGSRILYGIGTAVGAHSPEVEEAVGNLPSTTSQRIAEKSGEGLAYGAPFGVPGAIGNMAGSAAEQAVNEFFPGHPIIAAGAGLATGLSAPSLAAKGAELAVKTGRAALERFSPGRSLLDMVGIGTSPINKAYNYIGANEGKGALLSGNMQSPINAKLQNAARESTGGAGEIHRAEGELFNKIGAKADELANRLGPDLTQQEMGEFIHHTAAARAAQLLDENNAWYQALDAVVPRATAIRPVELEKTLSDIAAKYQGASNLSAIYGDPKIHNTLQALSHDIYRGGGVIPYDALAAIRTDIGQTIGKGAINPDTNIKQLRSVYRALTEDLRSAYTTPHAQWAFDTVTATAEKAFDKIETLKAFTQLGVEPEIFTQRLFSQINKGGTRLDQITAELNNIDPDARSTIMGYTLRRMGEMGNKQFNVNTFYDHWSKMSPEGKDLFPAEIRDGVETLGLLSGLTKDSARGFYNSSHTSGNLSTLGLLKDGIRGLVFAGRSAVAGGFGSGASKIAGSGLADDAVMLGSAAGVAIGTGMTAAAIATPLAEKALAHLVTNKWFATWLATEAPKLTPDKLPNALANLARIVGPETAPYVEQLGNIIEDKLGIYPGSREKGRGFAQGGSISNDNTTNVVTPQFGKNIQGGYSGADRTPVTPSSVGVQSKDKSLLDMIADEIALKMPMGGTPREGFAGSTRQRGAQWDFKANEWEPPFDLNDAANDFRKYAGGGSVSQPKEGPSYGPNFGNVKYPFGTIKDPTIPKIEWKWDYPEDKPLGANPDEKGFTNDPSLMKQKVDLINKMESGNRNVRNYRYDATHTNGGYSQTSNTLWRENASPEILAKYPTAMDAPKEIQDQVTATVLSKKNGEKHWLNFNSPLKAAWVQKFGGAGGTQGQTHLLDQVQGSLGKPSVAPEADAPEPVSNPNEGIAQEHVQQAASMGADPLVQRLIYTIWQQADLGAEGVNTNQIQ